MATEWRPDTCGCILQYDESFRFERTIMACQKHVTLTGLSSHLTAVLLHNQRKNEVVRLLTEEGGADAIVGYDESAPANNDPVIVLISSSQTNRAAVDRAIARASSGAIAPVVRVRSSASSLRDGL